MLVYEHRSRYNVLSDETHMNPEHVACVMRRITGPNIYRYEAITVGGTTEVIDSDGYDRIVKWMEQAR